MGIKQLTNLSYPRSEVILISIYTFFSGFVFFEPSLAELLLIAIILPFCILHCNFKYIDLWILLLLLSLDFIGLYILFFKGWFNLNYLLIDIYLFGTFFLLCSLLRNLGSEEYIKTVMYSWTIAGLINIVACLYGLFMDTNEIFGIAISSGLRWKGFFKDANVLGPFVTVPCLYWLSNFFKKTRNHYNTLLIFLALSCGIFLSFSRAAWINLLTGIGVLIFLNLKMSGIRTLCRTCLLLILTFLLITAIFHLDPTLSDLFFSRLSLQTYDSSRFSMQAGVTQMITSHPVTGISAGNYTQLLPYDTHSLYVRMLGEHGFIGFFFLAILLSLSFSVFWRLRNKYPFFLAAFSGLLINSLVIDTWHWRHLWLFLAIALSQKYKDLK